MNKAREANEKARKVPWGKKGELPRGKGLGKQALLDVMLVLVHRQGRGCC